MLSVKRTLAHFRFPDLPQIQQLRLELLPHVIVCILMVVAVGL